MDDITTNMDAVQKDNNQRLQNGDRMYKNVLLKSWQMWYMAHNS